MLQPIMENENLSEHNYRSFAKKVIEKYNDMGMIADAMVWGAIVGYYERDILRAETPGSLDD